MKKKLSVAKCIFIPIGISAGIYFLMTILKMVINFNSGISSILQITLPLIIILFGIPMMLAIRSSQK